MKYSNFKRQVSVLLAFLLLIPFIPTGYATSPTTLSQWAVAEVEGAKQNQLVPTKLLNSYQQNITREEFAELAVRLYEALSQEEVTVPTSLPFTDTKNVEVLKAHKLGIVNGVAPNKFAPQQSITRQEIAVMLHRTILIAIPQPHFDLSDHPELKFNDEAVISSWALHSVKYLNYKGILGGIGKNTINPKGNTTREMAIVLVQRSFKNFYKEPVTLVVGTRSFHRSLDPHNTNDLPSSRIMAQIYDTLLTIDDHGEIAPGLAKTWRQIDPFTYEFVLNNDIKFHNGETLTAHDVAFTLKRATESFYIAHILEQVDSNRIQVIDANTIRISTRTPFTPFLRILTHVSTSILNEKAVTEAGDDYHLNPIGTGPFQIHSANAAEGELMLKAFRDYHGQQAKSDFVKVVLVMGEEHLILNKLNDGSIDLAFDISAPNIESNKIFENLTFYSSPNQSVAYVGLNCSKDSLKDVRIRQAINYAVDTSAIVEEVYKGVGTPATGPISPEVWGAHPNLKNYDYNIEKAKKLLAEAGYSSGLKLTIAVNENPQRMAVANMLRQQLSLVNIDLEIKVLQWGEFLESNAQGVYDLFLLGWVTVTGEADYGLYPTFHSSMAGSAGNCTFYNNPRVDELLELARTTSDPATRKELYYEVQEIITEESPWIYLQNGENNSVSRKGISGFQHHPMGYHRLSTVEVNQ